ncbi:MAG: response regulator, partial [Anaerolineae bacterium]
MSNQPSKILVVDDNETVRDLLSIRLETRGHVVETAANGRIALEKMRLETYDLVLLDIMMPEVNGYDVLETMQSDPDLTQLPVIVLSALNDMNSVVRCVSLGAADYLFKPINSALLWARLDNTLEKKHLRDQEKAYAEELSVLQKIDRELNTALDVEKASEIALKWAITQVDSVAGLVGIMADNQFHITAAHHLDETGNMRMALTSLITDLLMADGSPRQQTFSLGQGLHPDANHRLMVPIRRNGALRGLILLENTVGYQDGEVNFLERLCSHAALALNNAQLFADVQAANQAKSHFVSVVAHELKAPMTVINAYIDLVAAAGAVSDKQQEFLDVMRLNVSRMATLVADLSEISRIETGKLRIKPTAVPIKAAIQEVNRSFGQEFQQKKQRVKADVPAD